MPAAMPLTDGQIQYALQALEGWTVENHKLHREFQFKNFAEAFGFMAKVALAAEKMDHHPAWCNVWNKVLIDLSTHSAGDAITELDIALARQIDALT